MKSIYKSLAIVTSCAVIAGAVDYCFPSSAIPGGYQKSNVDQIVTFVWEDNGYSGELGTTYEYKTGLTSWAERAAVGGADENGPTQNPLNITDGGMGLSWAVRTLGTKLNAGHMTFNMISGLFVPVWGAQWYDRRSEYGFYNNGTVNDGSGLQQWNIAASNGREQQIFTDFLNGTSVQKSYMVNGVKKMIAAGHEWGNHTLDHMETNSPYPKTTFDKFGMSEGFDDGISGKDALGKVYSESNEGIEGAALTMGWKKYAGRALSKNAWLGVIAAGEEPTNNYISTTKMLGFSAPRFEYNSNLYAALSTKGYLYDGSMEEGLQSDFTGHNALWPYTLDNGSPESWTKQQEGKSVYVDSFPTGLWEYPVNALVVPSSIREAVWTNYNQIQIALGSDSIIPKDVFLASGKILATDHDMFIEWGMTGANALATLKYTLDLRLAGNKAPLKILAHTDFFTPCYDYNTLQSDWNKSTYGLVITQGWNTWVTRKQVFEDFVDYAKSLGVLFKSAKETIEYVRALGSSEIFGTEYPYTNMNWVFSDNGTTPSTVTTQNITGDINGASVTIPAGGESFPTYSTAHAVGSFTGLTHISCNYSTTEPLLLKLIVDGDRPWEVLLNNRLKSVNSGKIPVSAFHYNVNDKGTNSSLDVSKITGMAVCPLTTGSAVETVVFSMSNFKLYGANVPTASDTQAPTLTLISPDATTSVVAGNPVIISWNAQDNIGVTNIRLDFSVNGGTTWNSIATNVTNSGSYSWTPTVAGTYKVRVTAFDAAGHSTPVESGSFAVTTATDTYRPTAGNKSIAFSEGDPIVTVALPVGSGQIISDGTVNDDLLLVSVSNLNTAAGAVVLGTTSANSSTGGTFTFTYTPTTTATVEIPADTITYTVRDAAGSTASGKVFVTINPVNDNRAIATDDVLTVAKGSTSTVNLLANDTDRDLPTSGNRLSVSLLGTDGGARSGTASVTGLGVLTYTGNSAGSAIADTIKYVLKDSTNYTGKAGFGPYLDTGMVVISITPSVGSNNPTAKDTMLTVDEISGSAVGVTMLSTLVHDADIANGDALTLTYTAPKYGTVTPASGTVLTAGAKLTYTYNQASTVEKFADTIAYTVTDKGGNSVSKTIMIAIDTLNDNAPVMAAESVTVAFNKVTTIPLPTITDGDLPAMFNNPIIDPTTSVSGVNGVITAPIHGTVSWINATQFGYEPNLATTAALDSFEYQILDTVSYDGANVHRVSAWIYLKIDQSSKDKPIAIDDNFTLNEGLVTIGNVLTNDLKSTVSGVANSGPSLDSVTLLTPPIHHSGTFTLNRNGSFTYTHDGSEKFGDQFTYTVTDVAGKTSVGGTVYFTINPLNDNNPVTVSDSAVVEEDGAVTIPVIVDGKEVDGDSATVLQIIPGDYSTSKGKVVVGSDRRTIIYTDTSGEEILSPVHDTLLIMVRDSVSYDLSNGHTAANTVFLTITPVNDHDPVISARATEDVFEGKTSTVIDFRSLVTDIDGDSPKITLISAGKFGNADSVGVDQVTYTHNGAEPSALNSVIDTLTFTASDADTTIIGTVLFRIMNRNDSKAEGNRDEYTVNETDTLVVVKANGVLKNDTDADLPASENILIATIADQAKNGSVTLAKDGSFSYIPQAKGNEFAADSFTYFLKDSTTYDNVTNSSNPVKYTVMVNVVNENDESPIAQVDSMVVGMGTTVTILQSGANSVLANDSDLDLGSTLTVDLVDSTSNGSLTLNSDGTFSYTHNGTASTTDSFRYAVSDGISQSLPVVVSIRVVSATQYALTVNGGTGSGSYLESQSVPVVATAISGKTFTHWSASISGILADSLAQSTTVTMPAQAVTVTAVFTIAETGSTNELIVTDGSGDGEYSEGTKVAITADVQSGKKFVRWESTIHGIFDDSTLASTHITMPAVEVTVTAIYEDVAVTIPADFDGDGAINIDDFVKVSDFWYKSAKGQTGFIELAPDAGTFEAPIITPDNKFDYKDLNRFVQYCYYYDQKGSGASLLSAARGTETVPVKIKAVRKNGKVTITMEAVNAENISAIACRLAEKDESATWREGSFLADGANSLAMRGKSGLALARISDKNRAVSGSGLIASAELETSDSTVAAEIVLVDRTGKKLAGVVTCTVVEDASTGVSLVLAPNPFTVDQPVKLIIRSENEPVVFAEAVIYDAVGNRLFHETTAGSANSLSFQWSGVTNGTVKGGAFKAVVKYQTVSRVTGILTGMIGLHK